jgi:hypothetical protein
MYECHDDTCIYLVYECIPVCPVCALIPICINASCVDENWYIICKQSICIPVCPVTAENWTTHSCVDDQIT